MLNCIIGASGSGKSHYIYEELQRFVKSDENIWSQNAFFIVPEQYTLETERSVLERFGNREAQCIAVHSFTNLALWIISRLGSTPNNYVDKGGRLIIMANVLNLLQNNLQVYKNMTNKAAFLKKLTRMCSELKSTGLDEASLQSIIQEDDSINSVRLQELLLIYSTYNAVLKNQYSDSADNIMQAVELLKERGDELFTGKQVFIDGFNGYTGVEYSLITELLKLCDVTMTFTLPYQRENELLFQYNKRMLTKINRICEDHFIEANRPVFLDETVRFESSDLKHLEANLLYKDGVPFDNDCPSIFISRQENIYKECVYAAKTIRKLVSEGCRFRDIGILVRDDSEYKGYLDHVLHKFDVPFFMDNRTPLISKPFIVSVLSALKMCYENWRLESVMEFLKSGFSPLDMNQVFLLENYAKTWNINGKRWTSEGHWGLNPNGYTTREDTRSTEMLTTINNARDILLEIMLPFESDIKAAKSAYELSSALLKFMDSLKLKEQIKTLTESALANGEAAKAQEYCQMWDILCKAMEQTAYILKHTEISLKRYAELLSLVIGEYDIGKIPSSVDEVIVANTGRSRMGELRALIILGVNEGVFPRSTTNDGLVNEKEKKYLKSQGVEMGVTREEMALMENFFLYSALTSAKEKVFLSYRDMTLSGKPLRPSGVIGKIKKMFPKVNIIDEDIPQHVDEIIEALFKEENPYKRQALQQVIEENPAENSRYNQIVQAIIYEKWQPHLSNETVDKLYSEKKYLNISPSALESFAKCNFMHYCKYILHLQPNQKGEFNRMSSGTFVHSILQEFVKRAVACNFKMTDDELSAIIDELLQRELNLITAGGANLTARFRKIFARLRSGIILLCKNILQEFLQSEFFPIGFETKFGDTNSGADVESVLLRINDKIGIRIIGTADRVDICKKADKTYVRIVDYKTGTKKFSLDDVVNGLNMQMLIYLFSMWENGSDFIRKITEQEGKISEITPAGILYAPSGTPNVKVSGMENYESELGKALSATFRQNGLVLDDIEVITAMEKNVEGRYIPVTLNKNGEVKDSPSLCDIEQLGKLREMVNATVLEMAKSLLQGDVYIAPLSKGNNDNNMPCVYCDYNAICRFDSEIHTCKRWK